MSCISGDDESRRGTPFFGCCSIWIFVIPFVLFGLMVVLSSLGGRRERISEVELWIVGNVIEGYVEPFLLGGGLYVLFGLVVIGLIADLVYLVRGWMLGRRR